MQQKVFSTALWTGMVFLLIVFFSLPVNCVDSAELEERAARKNPVEECNWIIIPGKSKALIKVWTWDNKIQNCRETVMYGDEDDTNIFADKKECMDKCGPKTRQ